MPDFVGARQSEGVNTYAHRKLRKRLLAELEQAGSTTCVRCGRVLTAEMNIHLDHHDDRQNYRGWACASCNVKAGARLGGKRAAAAKAVREGRTTSLRW